MLEDENKQLDTNETPEGADKTEDVAEEIKDSETPEAAIVEESAEEPAEKSAEETAEKVSEESVEDTSEEQPSEKKETEAEEDAKEATAETVSSEEPIEEAKAEPEEEKAETEEKAVAAAKTGSADNKPAAKKFKLEKGTKEYEIFDWIRTICIGVLAGIFIVVFLAQRDDVSGDSMSPTLISGDIVFTQKISNYFHSYKRGDIVVLDGKNMDGYTSKEYLIKRIVGLPGETVLIEDGYVFIKPADSDEFYRLQEDYLITGIKTYMGEGGLARGYDEVTLGENEYYVLGDNRPVSNDSRYLGPFTADRIKGVAIIRVFPLNEIKIL